ncbi:PREDICTED: uncharacterized protein LOC107067262 isoform X2 [Polistes dominula]|uniref:Uncharacterized protein LOC107067262 isoform X2 n=1 Tax=Polistes dominula TaxID=743375 RepID=A0ABM1ID00_POLDO|nr:PREDICTED: uncharacterized protein LOC107067262 isoform X2 [Polistes dominula]
MTIQLFLICNQNGSYGLHPYNENIREDVNTLDGPSTSANNINKRMKSKKRREVQQEFSHSWLSGTLKGHTSNVFNMSFSSNGKHLASCAEDHYKRPHGIPMAMMTPKVTPTTRTMSRLPISHLCPLLTNQRYVSLPSYVPPPPPAQRINRCSNVPKNKGYQTSMGYQHQLQQQQYYSRSYYQKKRDQQYYQQQREQQYYQQEQKYNQEEEPEEEEEGKVQEDQEQEQTPLSSSTSTELSTSKNLKRKSASPLWIPPPQQPTTIKPTSNNNSELKDDSVYIPEYKQNVCNLNHYQQVARNIYFHQVYMQLMSIEQLFISGRPIISLRSDVLPNFRYIELAKQLAQQLAEQLEVGKLTTEQLTAQLGEINAGVVEDTSLYKNAVLPYWMEGRYPSKETYGFVETKRNEFIINDTILEYVLRTYVHHPLYLIEAGYPCALNFDARFKQFINNLHKPFKPKNKFNMIQSVNNVNTVANNNSESDTTDNDEQLSRDCVRSSSFTSSSRKDYINETTTRQRSSSISNMVEFDTIETRCSMCLKGFYLYRANGDLDKTEVCIHHPGELIFHNRDKVKTWTCCKNRASVLGCKTETSHVWKSYKKNFTSSQIDYVRTKPSEVQSENRIYGIYGIDCEMVTTEKGLELARVSLVNIHGHVVYNEYVIPSCKVIDHNTRFSGITPDDLSKATKTLKVVQQDLLGFIKAETILIGHALENDLKVLRMIHYTCIDTALLFKHPDDLPFRHSLRVLSKSYLNRIIQNGSHNSVEDTLSALDLVLYKLRTDGF